MEPLHLLKKQTEDCISIISTCDRFFVFFFPKRRVWCSKRSKTILLKHTQRKLDEDTVHPYFYSSNWGISSLNFSLILPIQLFSRPLWGYLMDSHSCHSDPGRDCGLISSFPLLVKGPSLSPSGLKAYTFTGSYTEMIYNWQDGGGGTGLFRK